MNKEQVAEIIDGMPQGLSVDEFLVELATRAANSQKAQVSSLESTVEMLKTDLAAAENEISELRARFL